MCLGIPGRIESIDEQPPPLRAGRVRFGGVVMEVNLSFTPEAAVGDYVLVHAGLALSRISEDEAAEVTAMIAQLEPEG